jgi:hypothetical protein
MSLQTSATLLLTKETAAAKGLVAGNFTLRRIDGSLVNGLAEKEVVTIAYAAHSMLI